MGSIKINLFKFLILFFSVPVLAQNLPQELKSMVDSNKTLFRKEDLNSDQKSFLWRNTTVDSAGFLRVTMSKDYMNLINSSFKRINVDSSSLDFYSNRFKSLVVSTRQYAGTFLEDENRVNIFFGRPTPDLMLTVWDYKKAGAKFRVVDEFLNQRVLNIPATLSLVVAENYEECMWTLAWLDSEISRELYILDKCKNSATPTKSPKEILEIANLLAISASRETGKSKSLIGD